jgi:hypothetical protein
MLCRIFDESKAKTWPVHQHSPRVINGHFSYSSSGNVFKLFHLQVIKRKK